ncbi:MAG: hypothetical protein Q4D25_11505 [Bacteroidales bacterium]|nr:hypothetical protein [Bacteroidales bacterium]
MKKMNELNVDGQLFIPSFFHFSENIISINTYYKKGSGAHQSWDNTYRTLQFDKAVGWSRWMKKNPGIHYDNPPYDDDYSFVFEDPDFNNFIEDTDSID